MLRVTLLGPMLRLCGIYLAAGCGVLAVTAQADDPADVSAERLARIQTQLETLAGDLHRFEQNTAEADREALADAAVYAKGVRWGLQYDSPLTAADLGLLESALRHGAERLQALEATADPRGTLPWQAQRGSVVRGYRSQVDGSFQPYGVVVPAGYDPARPMRLDIVLHGSTKPVGMSELRFMARFEEGASGGVLPDADYLELHPLGRVENCYRWAGETDVFEALAAVMRQYAIDPDRIVLRGMSMGASGTWHLGLKHPDRFVALGPYCGYVDTHQFSETPIPTFIRVGELPAHQELGLHMLDSIDYAANAGIVPAIACMGEKDVFFQAHELMREAMRRERLEMVNLISPGTGHVIDPVTQAEQLRRISQLAAQGLNHEPASLRFVTWTLKYSTCHWVQLLGLERHYARAEFAAERNGDQGVVVHRAANITRFRLRPGIVAPTVAAVRVEQVDVPLPVDRDPRGLTFARDASGWRHVTEDRPVDDIQKTPGLQGPIDDAFVSPFLCVRGTGQAWNPDVQTWSEAALQRFAYEWQRYLRGDLPIKDDSDVTDADLEKYNLILFGDPGSNRWIAKTVPYLPLQWTRERLSVAGREYSARDHSPALIYPNRLSPSARYVVINSGHTFHEAEFSAFNYLLFPRLGDWAVLQIAPPPPRTNSSDPPALLVNESPQDVGYFDETWQLPAKD